MILTLKSLCKLTRLRLSQICHPFGWVCTYCPYCRLLLLPLFASLAAVVGQGRERFWSYSLSFQFACCCLSMSSAVQKQLTAAGFEQPSFGLSNPSVMAPPAQQQQQAQSSAMKVGIDLTAGTVAGVAQLIVGHPFDTIKVKLQSQSSAAGAAVFKGPLDAAKQTLLNEGLKGIYKGISAPLATVALFNAVLFASRGQMEVLLKHTDGSALTLSDQLVAAVGASCAVSLVATPTELMKCRLQAQGCSANAIQRLVDAGLDPSKHTIYRGPIDVARHVVQHEGGPLGLFKGLGATLWRESLGNMAMFGVYELIKQQMVAAKGLTSTQQLSHSDLLLAGGLGGTAFWLGCYPLDIIKSKLQVDSYSKPQFRGIMDCGRQIVADQGVKGLYRGFAPALARSFPANAVCFAVYEAVKAALSPAISDGALGTAAV